MTQHEPYETAIDEKIALMRQQLNVCNLCKVFLLGKIEAKLRRL